MRRLTTGLAVSVIALCQLGPSVFTSSVAQVIRADTELQVRLLALQLPAERTDRTKVMEAMDQVVGRFRLQAAGRPGSGLWNIARLFYGTKYETVGLDLFPDYTTITLFKRPGDADTHQDLIDALRTSFLPLGFTPSVDTPEDRTSVNK